MKMSTTWKLASVVMVLAMVLAGCQGAAAPTAAAGTSSGAIGSAERANQEYVWISNFSSLPLFVERVYPALEAFARDFGVTVRKAGPTTDDLAAYIATVETECARKPAPAGIIVVGGWDQSLQEPVNKCIAAKVPVVVTDGDLPNSNRLSYVGTNWYNLGVTMAKYQIDQHKAKGLDKGKVAILAPINMQNMQEAIQGIKDTMKGTGIDVVAVEDNESNAGTAATKMAAILSANPDLTGVFGLDSESPPGIVTALDEAGKAGQLIVTVNESGLDFFNNIKAGKANLITIEKYDVMEYLALSMLYMWHNNAIKPAGLDPWVSNWMPNKVDSGLIQVTKDNVDEVIKYYTEQQNKGSAPTATP